MKHIAKSVLFVWLGLCCALVSGTVHPSDFSKEARWAEQVTADLFDGEALWLSAGTKRFLALHTSPENPAGGSVIVLHGLGVHPDWPQVINPIRVALAESGWHTLSLQLPVLANGVPAEDYRTLLPTVGPRLVQALVYLRDVATGPIFIVAHSMGSTMAIHALVENPSLEIAGLVMIGAGSGGGGSFDPAGLSFQQLDLSVFDIVAEYDLKTVIRGSRQRAKFDHLTDFSQIEIDGADHFFEGQESILIDEVASWLGARLQR